MQFPVNDSDYGASPGTAFRLVSLFCKSDLPYHEY